jgi:hypothetical protein
LELNYKSLTKHYSGGHRRAGNSKLVAFNQSVLNSEFIAAPAEFGVTDTCYVSNILTVGSEPVISFLNRADPFHRVCLFCIFVTNTIYVLEVEVLQLVLLARNHKF